MVDETEIANEIDASVNIKSEPELIGTGVSKEIKGSKSEFSLLETTRQVGVVDFSNGDLSVRKKESLIDSARLNKPLIKSMKTMEHSIPIQVGALSNLVLPFGLCVISGATAGGKSSFLRALPNVTRLLAVEPPDSEYELENLHLYDNVDAAILQAAYQSSQNQKLHAIDSLRAPLFEINGPAGEKGVIMPFFTSITRVSNSLAAHGITMLATVNPMNTDPGYVSAFLSKLSSAVPCFINLMEINKPQDGSLKGAEFSGTVSTREARGHAPFYFNEKSKQGARAPDEVLFDLKSAGPIENALTGIQLSNLKEELI